MYIVFEGIVGTGKSSHSKRYADYLKKKYPNKKVIWTREPGGSEIADTIRKVVQESKFEEEMEPICEAYLYAASRAQTLRSVVSPVLKKGGIVVSDRSFLTSLTNQAFGRRLGIDTVMKINSLAIADCIPDKIVYLNLPIKIGLQRAFDKEGDKFESLGEEFYNRVLKGYKKIQKLEMFKKRWVNVNTLEDPEETFNSIVTAIGL
jgi:dTMP kinase